MIYSNHAATQWHSLKQNLCGALLEHPCGGSADLNAAQPAKVFHGSDTDDLRAVLSGKGQQRPAKLLLRIVCNKEQPDVVLSEFFKDLSGSNDPFRGCFQHLAHVGKPTFPKIKSPL